MVGGQKKIVREDANSPRTGSTGELSVSLENSDFRKWECYPWPRDTLPLTMSETTATASR